MKKLVFFFLLIVLISGCSLRKETFDLEKIQQVADEQEYQFLDVSSQFDDEKIVSAHIVATTLWQIEFYVLDTEENAYDMFMSNQASFKLKKESTSSEEEKSGVNYHYYSLITADTFMYLNQVDNTLVYIHIPVEHRKKALNFLKKIDY